MTDIGSTLREARMRDRIDISEVETRTKIRAKYLRAIENEEWDLLPGPVYVKSFLRTYGEFLGVDTRQLVDEYKRRYERPADQDLRPIQARSRDRERERRRRRRPRLGPVGAVVLVLAAVVAALFFIGGGLGSGTSSTPTSTAGASASSTSSTSATSHTTTAAHHPPHHKPKPHTPPPKPTTVSLKLTPTSTVYVCVEDGNGKKIVPGVTYAAGQQIPTATGKKLLVTLGNSSVQMKINGKSVPVAPGAPIGYELTPGSMKPLARGLMPTCA
jgi:cytoskeletal protein RodZ